MLDLFFFQLQFLIVLTVVFIIELIVEISMAVLAFTAQDYIRNYLKGLMTPTIETYDPDPISAQMLDQAQIAVRKKLPMICCISRSTLLYESGQNGKILTSVSQFWQFLMANYVEKWQIWQRALCFEKLECLPCSWPVVEL